MNLLLLIGGTLAGFLILMFRSKNASASTEIEVDNSPKQNNNTPKSFYDSEFYTGEPPVLTKPQRKLIPYENEFRTSAATYGVDWMLIASHAFVESNYNPRAVNKSDNESIGLCQILCNPDGNGGCENNFNVEGWNDITRDDLMDPQQNTDIAAQIIAENVQRYGMPRAIAVYNSYDQRKAPQSGPFKNQSYVNKVLSRYNELKAQE